MKSKKTITAVATVKSQDAQIAAALRKLYSEAQLAEHACLWARAKLGALLIKWEQFLGASQGGFGSSGEGLKGWLEKNMPELGYTTALGYKESARQAVGMLGGGAVAIAALLGEDSVTQPDGEVIDVPSEVIEKRDELFANIDSRRKLEQAYFDFMNGDGAQQGGKKKRQPRKVVAVAEGEGLSMSDSATVMWADAMRTFEENRAAFHSAARDLKPMVARKFLSELKMLVDALEKRIDGED